MKTYTSRGFAIYEGFDDDHGHTLRVQESSAVDPHVWLFIEDKRDLPSPPHCITPDHLHLNPEQATKLRDALTAWLEDDEVTSPK